MQINTGGDKKIQNDASIESMLKNEKLNFSDKSSYDKLMISEENYSSQKSLRNYISSRQNNRPHLELEKTKSTPLSMRKSSLK